MPGKPLGILPANAQTCVNYGKVPESNKASIFFEWSAVENTYSYTIQVFESDNQVASNTTTTTNSEIVLDKAKLYSWTITAKNSQHETQSDTFSFVTPGNPVTNFAPYPAAIYMEVIKSKKELLVSWKGKDEDGDSLVYDVLILMDNLILAEFENLISEELYPLEITEDVEYSVQVTSKDSFGNFSISTQMLKVEDL